MSYPLEENHNISDALHAALTRKQHLEEMDVTGGTTQGSHQQNTDKDLAGVRKAGGIFMGKGGHGDFAYIANDLKNQGHLAAYMDQFRNGGFNDDIFGPPVAPPLPPEASA